MYADTCLKRYFEPEYFVVDGCSYKVITYWVDLTGNVLITYIYKNYPDDWRKIVDILNQYLTEEYALILPE